MVWFSVLDNYLFKFETQPRPFALVTKLYVAFIEEGEGAFRLIRDQVDERSSRRVSIHDQQQKNKMNKDTEQKMRQAGNWFSLPNSNLT